METNPASVDIAADSGADGLGTAVVKPAVSMMLAKDLHAAVSNALNCAASPADGIPAIAAVRIEASESQLVTVATNRFILGATRVDYSGAPFTATLAHDDAKTLVKIARTLKRDERIRTVELDVADDRVTFRFITGEALTVRDADVEFVKWRHLLPADMERMGAVTGVRYNPDLVAKFAKVVGDSPMVMMPTTGRGGEPGPTLVQIGEDFIGVLMPVRSPNGETETYTRPLWVDTVPAVQTAEAN
ncbi:hypothetical protein ACWDTP_04590 [Mycobacterium sp. NPDC003449]